MSKETEAARLAGVFSMTDTVEVSGIGWRTHITGEHIKLIEEALREKADVNYFRIKRSTLREILRNVDVLFESFERQLKKLETNRT